MILESLNRDVKLFEPRTMTGLRRMQLLLALFDLHETVGKFLFQHGSKIPEIVVSLSKMPFTHTYYRVSLFQSNLCFNPNLISCEIPSNNKPVCTNAVTL